MVLQQEDERAAALKRLADAVAKKPLSARETVRQTAEEIVAATAGGLESMVRSGRGTVLESQKRFYEWVADKAPEAGKKLIAPRIIQILAAQAAMKKAEESLEGFAGEIRTPGLAERGNFWTRDLPSGVTTFAMMGGATALGGPAAGFATAMAMTSGGLQKAVEEAGGSEDQQLVAGFLGLALGSTEMLTFTRALSRMGKTKVLAGAFRSGNYEQAQEILQTASEELLTAGLSPEEVDVGRTVSRSMRAGWVGRITGTPTGGGIAAVGQAQRGKRKKALEEQRGLRVAAESLQELKAEGALVTEPGKRKSTPEVARETEAAVEKEILEKPIHPAVEEIIEEEEQAEGARVAPVTEAAPETAIAPEQRQQAPSAPEQKVIEEEGPAEEQQVMAFPGEISSDVKEAIQTIKDQFRTQKKTFEGIEPSKGVRAAFMKAAVDKYAPLSSVQKQLHPKADISDPLLGIRLWRGKAVKEMQKADRTLFKPLLRDARKAKITLEGTKKAGDPGISAFLIARHAPERNVTIQERRGGEDDLGIGMTTEVAEKITSDVSRGPKAERYQHLAEQFDKITKQTRETWVEGGLESREFVDALEKRWPSYAPARTMVDFEHLGVGRGMDIRGKEFKAAMGRKTMPHDPLTFATVQLEQAITRAEKNKATQRLGNYLNDQGGSIKGFAKHVKGVSRKEKIVSGLVKEVPDPAFMNQDDVIAYKVGGKTKFIQFEEDFIPLAKSLKNMGAKEMGQVVQFLEEIDKESHVFNPTRLITAPSKAIASGQVTRYLAQASTRYNPAFPVFNMTRDIATGAINSVEHGERFAAKVVAGVPGATKALIQEAAGKKVTGPYAEYIKRYRESGAPIAFLDFNGIQDQYKRLRRDLKQAQPGTINQIRRGWVQLFRGIAAISDVSEQSLRLSAFKNAIDVLDMTDERAGLYSKELTVNFEQKGDLGNMVNSLYMFANAGVQGVVRGGRALRSPKVRRIIYSGMAGVMIWDQITRALLGTDDDGENFYDKIPDHILRTNIIIPVLGGKDGDYISIPQPFFFRAFFNMARNVSSSLSGDRPEGKAIGSAVSGFFDAFNPLGSTDSLLLTVAPTLADPFLEVALNRDWANRPISPEINPYGHKGPDSKRFWPDVNPLARDASSFLNSMSGGDDYEPGLVDVSPETIEHFIRFSTGGAGATALRMQTVAARVTEGEAVRPFEIPIFRRFYREQSPFRTSKPFKEAMGKLEEMKARAEGEEGGAPGPVRGLLRSGTRVGRNISKLLLDVHLKSPSEQNQLYEEADKLRRSWLTLYRKEYPEKNQ